MNSPHGQDPDNTQSSDSGSGEYVTDEFDRSLTGKHSSGRRRRRRSKRKSREGPGKILIIAAAALFCIGLVSVGLLLGTSYSGENADAERYRLATEARTAERDEWLSECLALGYLEWACERFDRVHFKKAERLDGFKCEHVADNTHKCTYKLGTAEVIVMIPEPYEVDGQYLAPRTQAHAIIGHSDINDPYHVSISEKGRIEIREHDSTTPTFIINPATGSLNALHPDLKPDE